MNWFLITILPIGIVLGIFIGRKRRMHRFGEASVAKVDFRMVALTMLTTLNTVVFAEAARIALIYSAPHLIWTMVITATIAMISSNALIIHENRVASSALR